MGKNSSAFVNFVEKMCIFYYVDVLKGATLYVGILLFCVKVELV